MDNKALEEGKKLALQFEKRGGVLPVAVQNVEDGSVLMLAYADPAAVRMSLESGYAAFYSTSRQKSWVKGETSGNRLAIVEILVDCDQDALLYRVRLEGDGACHTLGANGKARYSCFYRRVSSTPHELAFLPEQEKE